MQSAALSPEAAPTDVAREVLARLESAWNTAEGGAVGGVPGGLEAGEHLAGDVGRCCLGGESC